MRRAFASFLGETSIFLAEGADWRWQRRAAAPIFRNEILLSFVPVFAEMAQRASRNSGGCSDDAERCMRMALKAQNQCRMTLETLAALKNPRVIVAQQTNIANGPQQVNNGPVSPGDSRGASARANGTRIEQNELLEVSDGERLDAGKARATSGSNSEMAPVDALDGPEEH